MKPKGLLLRLTALLLVAGLMFAAPALAGSAFNTLFHEYQSTGTIKACKHSTGELQSAKNEVPPDITQYAPDFPVALAAALAAHAHGACGGAAAAGAGGPAAVAAAAASTRVRSGTAPGPTPAPLASATFASPITQAAVAAAGGGGGLGRVPLIILAVVLGALALGGVWWTVTTLRGGELRRGSAGHALGEARLRARGTLREFGDWLRIGR